MSRSGYSDSFGDERPGQLELYRANVERAFAGKRGQAFLRELATTLDAMPVKRLAAESFQAGGEDCTLGCVLRARGVDTTELDDALEQGGPDGDRDVSEQAAAALGLPRCMAAELMFHNDEGGLAWNETPEQRWQRMRRNVARWLEGEAP